MFVLILAFGLHQQVFTDGADEAVRFGSYEACAKVAKAERERLRPRLRGEYTLYCVSAESVKL